MPYVLLRADGALVAGPTGRDVDLPAAATGESVATVALPAGECRWDAASRSFVLATPPAPTLTRTQYRRRFTRAERALAEQAGLGYAPDGSALPVAVVAAARAALSDLLSADTVDPTDADATAGVAAMAQLGVLTAARGTAVSAAVGTYAGEPGYVGAGA